MAIPLPSPPAPPQVEVLPQGQGSVSIEVVNFYTHDYGSFAFAGCDFKITITSLGWKRFPDHVEYIGTDGAPHSTSMMPQDREIIITPGWSWYSVPESEILDEQKISNVKLVLDQYELTNLILRNSQGVILRTANGTILRDA